VPWDEWVSGSALRP